MSAAQHPVPVQPPLTTPSPSPEVHKPRRSFLWIVLLVAVIVGGIVIWRRTAKQEAATPAPAQAAIRTGVVRTGSIQKTIRVGGQTTAIEFSNLTAPIMRGREASSEMILLFLADGGSYVKKGQLVAQIDAQALKDHIDDLGDTIEQAEGDIRKRKAEQSIEWETMNQNLRVAKASMDKAELDFKSSEILTDIQQQIAKLSLDETRAKHKQLQADFAEKKKAHAADIRILELTLLRHTQHRDRHRRDLQAFSIKAPMDGLVVMEQVFRGSEFGQIQQGDRLNPGQRFMKIVNTNKMQVEGNINQAESGSFRIGQKAHIKLDAFKDVEFAGTVYSLGALAVGGFRQSQFIRNVPIRIAIEGSHPKLIPDLSASADVVIASAADQVLVPLSAVRYEGDKPVVYVKDQQGFTARPVELGIQSDLQAAITSGLKPGETVRLN